jgi:hypothetical protein
MKIEHEWAGAAWLERGLVVKLSPLGRVVADILGFAYRGLYHIPPRQLGKIRWDDAHRIAVNVSDHGLATFDGRVLTDLVIACHECHVRMAIEGCNSNYVTLVFSQRAPAGPGVSIADGQPTIEEQVATVRQLFRVAEGA